MRVVFSDRAYTALLSETLCKITTETGGVFLGKYENDTWYIVESLDPGPNSIFEVAYFEYDQPYVKHLINKKVLLYKEKLDLIGLWHRHPGSLDRFSGTDDGTNTQYAARRTYGAISMLVNIDPKFRLTIYHVGQPCSYRKIQDYLVGDSYFPEGMLNYKDFDELQDRINNPHSYLHNSSVKTSDQSSLLDIMTSILPSLRSSYLYNEKINLFGLFNKEDRTESIAELISSDVMYLSEQYHMRFYPTTSSNKIVIAQKFTSYSVELIFTYSARAKRYILRYRDEMFFYESGLIEKLIKKEELPDDI